MFVEVRYLKQEDLRSLILLGLGRFVVVVVVVVVDGIEGWGIDRLDLWWWCCFCCLVELEG